MFLKQACRSRRNFFQTCVKIFSRKYKKFFRRVWVVGQMRLHSRVREIFSGIIFFPDNIRKFSGSIIFLLWFGFGNWPRFGPTAISIMANIMALNKLLLAEYVILSKERK